MRWRGKSYDLTMNGDKPSVYVETTIVSYLAARPSRDALLGAHQAITHDWWALRANYALHSSQLVQNESDAGDAEQVAKRKDLIAACSFLGSYRARPCHGAGFAHCRRPAPQSAGRRGAYCRGGEAQNGVSTHLELQTYCQPDDAARNGCRARKTGVRAALLDHP